MSCTSTDLNTLEKHLAAHTYLAGCERPGKADADVINQLREKKIVPNACTHPNVYAWFSFVGLFTPDAQKLWCDTKCEAKTDCKNEKPAGKPAGKPEAKKETKPAGKSDDVDLFGDEEEDPEVEAAREKRAQEALAAKAAKNAGKKAVIAKTIVVFEVKVFEESEDLDALAKKIFEEINPDGLTWNKNYQLIPIAYGMKKLSIGMVIEDDKILTDDIFEKILSWEDTVQSVDIANMQKV